MENLACIIFSNSKYYSNKTNFNYLISGRYIATELLDFDLIRIENLGNAKDERIILQFLDDNQYPATDSADEVFEIYIYDIIKNCVLISRKCFISEIKIKSGIKEITFSNVIYRFLNANIGQTYSKFCNLVFCSPVCGLNKENYSRNITINGFFNLQTITVSNLTSPEKYINGSIEIGGKYYNITSIQSDTIYLSQKLSSPPTIPYITNIYEGCDKTKSSCKNRFNNLVNFQGIID